MRTAVQEAPRFDWHGPGFGKYRTPSKTFHGGAPAADVLRDLIDRQVAGGGTGHRVPNVAIWPLAPLKGKTQHRVQLDPVRSDALLAVEAVEKGHTRDGDGDGEVRLLAPTGRRRELRLDRLAHG